ncbi:hypothetical protein BH23GEM3_BH23GEM3_27150 [soil metagenome]
MVFTRKRETLGLVLFATALLSLPSPLLAQIDPINPAGVAKHAALKAREDVARDSVVALAKAQLGRRYVLGGERPDEGFDCSGLIRYIMSGLELRLPRTAALQALIGREVPKDTERLKPGDLLTFGKGSRITHVGVYIGNGRYIHASSGAGKVVESHMDRTPNSLVRSWRGVRRLMTGDTIRLSDAG